MTYKESFDQIEKQAPFLCQTQSSLSKKPDFSLQTKEKHLEASWDFGGENFNFFFYKNRKYEIFVGSTSVEMTDYAPFKKILGAAGFLQACLCINPRLDSTEIFVTQVQKFLVKNGVTDSTSISFQTTVSGQEIVIRATKGSNEIKVFLLASSQNFQGIIPISYVSFYGGRIFYKKNYSGKTVLLTNSVELDNVLLFLLTIISKE